MKKIICIKNDELIKKELGVKGDQEIIDLGEGNRIVAKEVNWGEFERLNKSNRDK